MRTESGDLRARVLNAIYWDLAVPRNRLDVDVQNGWVTVSGMVDLPYQRSCAESDARSVPGVAGVTNLIRLADDRLTKPHPEEIAQAVIDVRVAERSSGWPRPTLERAISSL